MRAIVSALFVLIMLQGIAGAQPTPPPPTAPPPTAGPPPPTAGLPPPPPYPAQQTYGPPIPLTPEDQRLLARGEITTGRTVGGVLFSWMLGFGSGQGIQGRWGDIGWKFTLAESGSFLAAIVGGLRHGDGIEDDDVSTIVLMATGLIVFTVSRVWSVYDAAVSPSRHNAKVREIKDRVGIPYEAFRVLPYAAPLRDGNGATAGGTVGLTLQF
jgi:hypothetical protein